MPRGKPPRPTTLQVDLRGDPSKRRRNTIEPGAPKGWAACPDHVRSDPAAHEEWNSVCEHLDSMDLLSTADARSIELYCLTYSRFRVAQEQVQRHGDVLAIGKNRHLQVSPFCSTMNRYNDDLRKWLVEFGLGSRRTDTNAGEGRRKIVRDVERNFADRR
jgi:P27 family predicted phage terminase small subunit